MSVAALPGTRLRLGYVAGALSTYAMEGLAAAALSIIDDPTINDANPILSKRPGIERQLAADVRAEKERAALKRAKKGLADQPHIPLNPRLVKKGAPKQDLVLETSLKKIATRGVV